MTPKALFVDFYGTIVEEEDAFLYRTCAEIARLAEPVSAPEKVGADWIAEFGKLVLESNGPNFISQREIAAESLRRVVKKYRVTLDTNEISRRQFEYWRNPKPYADAVQFLTTCPVPVFVVSNIDRGDLAQAIERIGIPAKDLITSEDVQSYKPRPEIFKLALKRSGYAADEVVHIGDSYSADVEGAYAMGIRACWMNRKKKVAPGKVHAFDVENFAEFAKFVWE